jgi:undecaprenyl pyrophosphate phosphatase UppP
MDTLFNSNKKDSVKTSSDETIEKIDDVSVKEDTMTTVKSTILLIGTILFLVIGLQTTDVIQSHLFTSLAIISATFTFYNFSNPKQLKK